MPTTGTRNNTTLNLSATDYPTTAAITYQGFPGAEALAIATLVQNAMGNPNFTNPEYLNKLAELLKDLATHIPTDNTGTGTGG